MIQLVLVIMSKNLKIVLIFPSPQFIVSHWWKQFIKYLKIFLPWIAGIFWVKNECKQYECESQNNVRQKKKLKNSVFLRKNYKIAIGCFCSFFCRMCSRLMNHECFSFAGLCVRIALILKPSHFIWKKILQCDSTV